MPPARRLITRTSAGITPTPISTTSSEPSRVSCSLTSHFEGDNSCCASQPSWGPSRRDPLRASELFVELRELRDHLINAEMGFDIGVAGLAKSPGHGGVTDYISNSAAQERRIADGYE